MNLFTPGDKQGGNTSLSPEEQDDLIPDLSTREELNEWERQNIIEAYAWVFEPRNLRRNDPLTEPYVRELHRRMFDQTWKLPALLGDARYWLEHQTFPADEFAVRFHHRLVWIHPFANGNGRHARVMADILVQRQGRPVFTWGGASIVPPGEFRSRYLQALRAADASDIHPILKFARS
jgi:fido (protein-threonine AMPylation protein)